MSQFVLDFRTLRGASALTYESIIRNAPIIVPLTLVAGIVAVTLYRPHPVPTASGVISMAAKRGSSPMACADALAKGMLQEKVETAANATATDQAISQSRP
jgi:hypothetical protein